MKTSSKFIILTNNRKVANLYQETDSVRYYENKDFLHILDKAQEFIYKGHILLSDPIYSHLEESQNPFKSILLSEHSFEANPEMKKCIDLAIKIASQIAIEKEVYAEEDLENFRFIDLKLLQEAIVAFQS